jgi:hypothetical protein
MGVGCFEGEDALRLFVVGDGEVVFGETCDDWVALSVDHGDVEEDEA